MRKFKVTVANDEVMHLERNWLDYWLYDNKLFKSFKQWIPMCPSCDSKKVMQLESPDVELESPDVENEGQALTPCYKCQDCASLSMYPQWERSRIRLAVHWILKIEEEK